MRKIIFRSFGVLFIIYVLGCGYMFFFQEGFIFHPEKISQTSKIKFNIPFEEINLKMEGATLNCAYFKIKNPKGLVFFLHGNAGNIMDQENAANFYTRLGYDFFAMDYRGFGKSTGEISSEKQFFDDIQLAYNFVKKSYQEKEIIVIGYSVGTGPASMIASQNHPKKLVLIAPYFSMKYMLSQKYKIVPSFLLKYPFETNKYLEEIKNPVLLVHGDKDAVIPFEASLLLSKLLKKGGEFYPIEGQDHNFFEKNKLFEHKITEFLKN